MLCLFPLEQLLFDIYSSNLRVIKMNQPNTEIISFQGGNGSSVSDAIEIVGAQSFITGIRAELEFILNHYGENNVEYIEGKTIIFSDVVIHHLSVLTKNNDIRNFFFNASGFQIYIEKEDYKIVNTYSSIN